MLAVLLWHHQAYSELRSHHPFHASKPTMKKVAERQQRGPKQGPVALLGLGVHAGGHMCRPGIAPLFLHGVACMPHCAGMCCGRCHGSGLHARLSYEPNSPLP